MPKTMKIKSCAVDGSGAGSMEFRFNEIGSEVQHMSHGLKW